MIELPPIVSGYSETINLLTLDEAKVELINKYLDEYSYWNEIKYKNQEVFDDVKELWAYLKAFRQTKSIEIYRPYRLHFTLTNKMMRMCHEFDMNFGGSWGSESVLPNENRKRFLISSIMEEAISSSQMEGASTTRKFAKEMLRKNLAPKDKSQRMIFNNFRTITFLSDQSDKILSKELILNIHRLITDGTLDNNNDCGRFRENDDVVVENGITHEVVHTPPSYKEIPMAIDWLVQFANASDKNVFIHPIIKAIILHFFIAYLHPFVDGNGRTARALFHWYLLKEGYWLSEYMSISKIIYKTKATYEKSFMKTEADSSDIGYFINYHINVLQKAFEELKSYIARKIAQQNDKNRLLRAGNLTPRQAEILYMMLKDENVVLTVKDVSSRLLVTPTTAKNDIVGLLEKDILKEIALNRQKKGYIRGEKFSGVIDALN